MTEFSNYLYSLPRNCPVCGAHQDRTERYLSERDSNSIVERWGCVDCHSEWQTEYEWATSYIVSRGDDDDEQESKQ